MILSNLFAFSDMYFRNFGSVNLSIEQNDCKQDKNEGEKQLCGNPNKTEQVFKNGFDHAYGIIEYKYTLFLRVISAISLT